MQLDDITSLKAAYELRGVEIIQLRNQVSELQDELAQLKEMLKLQRKRQFGHKSEAGAEDSTVTVRGHTRQLNKRGKRFDTSGLPRHTIIHELSDMQLICNCCTEPYHCIGQDSSEEIGMVPSCYYMIEHIRKKYACRTCHKAVMAPKPEMPLPKIIAGASLLTDITVNKYHFHYM